MLQRSGARQARTHEALGKLIEIVKQRDAKKLMADPFYGVDGDLLVEDLAYKRETVEKILNGTWKPEFYAQLFLPTVMFAKYPQLKDERDKRAHRKAYREKWELRKKTMKAKRELNGR